MNISRVQCAGCESQSRAFEGKKAAVAKNIAKGIVAAGVVAGGVYAVKSGKAGELINKIADSNTFKSVTRFVGETAGKVGDFFKSIPEKLSNLGSKIKDILPSKAPKA